MNTDKSTQVNYNISISNITKIINRALENQKPPSDEDLLELFNKFKDFSDKLSSSELSDQEKKEVRDSASALLYEVFAKTSQKIEDLEKPATDEASKDKTKPNPELIALQPDSSFHRDLKRKSIGKDN